MESVLLLLISIINIIITVSVYVLARKKISTQTGLDATTPLKLNCMKCFNIYDLNSYCLNHVHSTIMSHYDYKGGK